MFEPAAKGLPGDLAHLALVKPAELDLDTDTARAAVSGIGAGQGGEGGACIGHERSLVPGTEKEMLAPPARSQRMPS